MDLFRNFERAIRDAIDGEFRSGTLGQLASRLKGSRSQARSAMRRMMRESRAKVDRYALPSFKALRDGMVRAMTAALRPVMNLLRGMSQAFGGGAAGSPPSMPGTSPGGAGSLPPRIPGVGAGAAGGSGGEGGGLDQQIRDAIRLLEGHGYTVLPPGQQRGAPEDFGFRRADQDREPVEPPARAPFHLGQPRERVEIQGGNRVYDENDPVFSGEMIDVESSNVHSIGFTFNWQNPAKGTLKVRFLQSGAGGKKTGPGPLYHYHDVHPNVFDAFLRAASKGKFVWDRLRVRGTVSGHRFQYELAGIVNGYLPRKATRYGDKEYFIQRQKTMRSAKTGQTRTFTSQLPDQFVQNLSRPRRGPQGFVPNSGKPRGPNRGMP